MHRWPQLAFELWYWHTPAGQRRDEAERRHRARMAVIALAGLAASSPPQRGRW